MLGSFEFLGAQWSLVLYPGGYNSDSDKVGIFIVMSDCADKKCTVHASKIIDVIKPAGGRVTIGSSQTVSPFSLTSGAWGYSTEYTRAELLNEATGLVRDDTLQLEAQLLVVPKTPVAEIIKDPAAGEHPLAAVGTKLLESGLHADVTVLLEGGDEMRLHRCLLAAASPVFRAMFEHKMVEATEGRVLLDQMPAAVFRHLVGWCYEGRFAVPADLLAPVLLAADRFDLGALAERCVDALAAGLSIDNLAERLLLTDQLPHRAHPLLRACKAFVRSDPHRAARWIQDDGALDRLPRLLERTVLRCLAPKRSRSRSSERSDRDAKRAKTTEPAAAAAATQSDA